MPATDINNFLLSLAAAIAAATGLSIAGNPRSIWVHDAVEDLSMPIYTVLRIYGGHEPGNFANVRVPWISVQADTRGKNSALVLAQAWRVHEALLNDDGTPWLDKVIDGKQLASDKTIEDAEGQWSVWVKGFTGVPAIIGRDESDRRIATDSFDVEFLPADEADGA